MIRVIGLAAALLAFCISFALADVGPFTPLLGNALTNTAVAVKPSAGQLMMLFCFNPNSSQVYIQLYNKAASGVTVGTTLPLISAPIASANTGGFALSTNGLLFSTAISAAATTTATGGSAPSTAVDCNFGFY